MIRKVYLNNGWLITYFGVGRPCFLDSIAKELGFDNPVTIQPGNFMHEKLFQVDRKYSAGLQAFLVENGFHYEIIMSREQGKVVFGTDCPTEVFHQALADIMEKGKK